MGGWCDWKRGSRAAGGGLCESEALLMTWRIRVGLIIGLTVVVVGTWGAWWKIEDRKVGGALEALRAAGQPSTIEDFVTEKIPADENAVTFLRQIKVKEAADNLESKPESCGVSGFGGNGSEDRRVGERERGSDWTGPAGGEMPGDELV